MLLGCVAAGLICGALLQPPSEDSSGVGILALNRDLLQRANVPKVWHPRLPGVRFQAHPKPYPQDPLVGGGAVDIEVSRSSEADALSAARAAAGRYVHWLTARQDRWIRKAIRGRANPALTRLRRQVLRTPARYELKYQTPATGAAGDSAALRGALIGLLVAFLGAALLGRRLAPASGAGARSPPSLSAGLAIVAAAAAVTALCSVASAGAYTFCFIALLFAAALAYALRGGIAAIRTLLVCVIVIAPFRGALLALADAIDLPNSYLSFNAIQPCLIAACAAAFLLAHRDLLERSPRPLLWAWAAITVACVADFATQTVGLKLYAIGLAQYLVYPTFAVVAWPLIGRRDREWLVWAFCALGVAVAVSEFLEVAGVYFAEAARVSERYAGSTGSVLHSGIFLGTTSVLALGALFARWSTRNAALAVGAIGVMVAGIALTYSRGGLGIAVIGALVLLVVLRRPRERLRLVGVVILATAVGLALSTAIGPSPAQLASRTGSGASFGSYPGNGQRIDLMRKVVNTYRGLPAKQQAFGRGLASTGNARKLTSQEPDSTESYPLQVLVETGALGVILIGAVLVWAVICFARTSWAEDDRLLKGVAAAGLGLSAEALIYMTLDVQMIALTWWLLLAVCLKAPVSRRRKLALLELSEFGDDARSVRPPGVRTPVSGARRS